MRMVLMLLPRHCLESAHLPRTVRRNQLPRNTEQTKVDECVSYQSSLTRYLRQSIRHEVDDQMTFSIHDQEAVSDETIPNLFRKLRQREQQRRRHLEKLRRFRIRSVHAYGHVLVLGFRQLFFQ